MSTYTGTFYERRPNEVPLFFAFEYCSSPVDVIEDRYHDSTGVDLYDMPRSEDEFLVCVFDKFFLVIAEYESDLCFEQTYFHRYYKGKSVSYIMNDTAMASIWTLKEGGKKLAEIEYMHTIYSIEFNGVDFAKLRENYSDNDDLLELMGRLAPKMFDPNFGGTMSVRYLTLKRHESWYDDLPMDETQVRLAHVQKYLNGINKDSIYADDEEIDPEKMTKFIQEKDLTFPNYNAILQELEKKPIIELHQLCTSIGPLAKANAYDMATLIIANQFMEANPLPLIENTVPWDLPKPEFEEFIYDQALYDKYQRQKREKHEAKIEAEKKRKEAEETRRIKEEEWAKERRAQANTTNSREQLRVQGRIKSARLIKEDKMFAARMADPELDINVHYFNELVKEKFPDLRQPQDYPQLEKAIAKLAELGQVVSPLPKEYLAIYRWTHDLLLKESTKQFGLYNRYSLQHNPPSIPPADIYIKCAIITAEMKRRKPGNKKNSHTANSSDGSVLGDLLKIGGFILVALVFLWRIIRIFRD